MIEIKHTVPFFILLGLTLSAFAGVFTFRSFWLVVACLAIASVSILAMIVAVKGEI